MTTFKIRALISYTHYCSLPTFIYRLCGLKHHGKAAALFVF